MSKVGVVYCLEHREPILTEPFPVKGASTFRESKMRFVVLPTFEGVIMDGHLRIIYNRYFWHCFCKKCVESYTFLKNIIEILIHFFPNSLYKKKTSYETLICKGKLYKYDIVKLRFVTFIKFTLSFPSSISLRLHYYT